MLLTNLLARSGRLSIGILALGVVLLLAGTTPTRGTDAEEPTGAQIYSADCASCHGGSGEGNPEEYAHPLVGQKSVSELARLIQKTMPADAPGELSEAESERVAAYVHDAFYSPAAQTRNTLPRIEFARLTVRQYRQVLADLVGSFRDDLAWSDERGLTAEYFNARDFRNRERVIERVDPRVKFDFGTGSPDAEKLKPSEFSIRWRGSVLAPETGEYEFVIRTEHAARLWVNDREQPLIDAWVKSGTDTEYRGTIYLLGGRVYPIRLEYSKAKQGVNDKEKEKEEPPPTPSSIALEWVPPHRVIEVIPPHSLSPARNPESFVSTAAFPPDDRSMGYERGTAISEAWLEATTEGAIELASYVSGRLEELAGVKDDAPDRVEKLKAFCRTFADRAFRRPLTEAQAAVFIDRQFADAADPELAVRRVILLVLGSPSFLYREHAGDGWDAHDVASRISFGLWDSIPDRVLREAAAADQLQGPEPVRAQAERMVTDLRTRAKVRDFLMQWLKVEQIPDIAKAPELFPDFDPATASDLRTSLDLFLADVVWGETSDFRELLLSESVYLNGRLGALYGAELPPDAPFQKVTLGEGQRAGVLTQPYLLSFFAYTATTSPIHRGVFLSRNVMGRSLRQPPEAVAPLAPDLHPGLTTRQRVALQTSPDACMSCHGLINPLGFTLEQFDAIGRYRTEEKGQPIDASGSYQTRNGEMESFQGVRDLAVHLAGSAEVQTAFVQNLFHYVAKQPIRAFGVEEASRLRESFAEHDCSIRDLLVAITLATTNQPGAVVASTHGN